MTDGGEGAGRRIGEIASGAGLTVRTLHHYEQIGLLVASHRSVAGHRAYTDADVERLYRIRLLVGLGFSLVEVGRALDDPAWDLHAVVSTHLHELERRLDTERRLRDRLVGLAARSADEPTTASELFDVLEDMTMLDHPVQKRISILVYSDLAAAFEFLTDVFGLGPGELIRDPDGVAVHGELEAGDGVVWLHPESSEFGLASPKTVGAATAMTAVMVDDVDTHHQHALDAGAAIEAAPVDQPYGYREYSARDCEGGLWSFMKAIEQ
ncbi:MAG TPA: MerR family transcriptional regulator [Ilumatobacteraceae bacterium]|nr:MerR family transcriptional regulator [Ilumatobacteraceae bacterium]